jgi:hypothetical protein
MGAPFTSAWGNSPLSMWVFKTRTIIDGYKISCKIILCVQCIYKILSYLIWSTRIGKDWYSQYHPGYKGWYYKYHPGYKGWYSQYHPGYKGWYYEYHPVIKADILNTTPFASN